MELTPGDVFAGHRIEGVAGRGGMGVVYRATELAARPRRRAEDDLARRWPPTRRSASASWRESKAAAGIDHPNVLPIFSAGEEDEVPYIAMRFVEGPDLRTLVRAGGPFAPERAAAVVAQVGSALDAAHARGLVHRDVKPANVLLDNGDHAYLTDFGLTKRLGTSATRAGGGWVGTLGYVAPEQIRDERIDGRADVYALGCVLHHLADGRAAVRALERRGDPLGPPPRPAAGGRRARSGRSSRARSRRTRRSGSRTPGDLGRAALAAVGAAPPAERRGRPRRHAPDAARGAGGRAMGREATAAALRRRRCAASGAPPRGSLAPPARAAPRAPRRPPPRAAAPPRRSCSAATTTRSPAPPAPPRRASTAPGSAIEGVDVGPRPNGIAIARGTAFVSRPRGRRLVAVDLERFDAAEPSYRIGPGVTDLDAGFGALWVAAERAGADLDHAHRPRQRRAGQRAAPAGQARRGLERRRRRLGRHPRRSGGRRRGSTPRPPR